MNGHPRFALLVPCRNGGRFLPRLFASVQAQTQPFDELWLCDDGSDDDSATLAEAAGFRVIRHSCPVGPSAARNRLVAATRCDWLHFHDADDTMAPDYLASVAKLADAEKVDAVICDMAWIDEPTGLVASHWHYDEAELHAAPRPYLIRNTIGGINGLYRRATFDRLGGFDATRDYWEDLELAARWCRGGARFRTIARVLVTAYRRPDSYSNQRLARAWRSKTELLATWLPESSPDEQIAIAHEAEHLAVRLLRLADRDGAAAALHLNHAAGGDAPETRNLVLRAAKKLVSPVRVLQWQDAWRRDRTAKPRTR